jgi:hypothetical protein
LYVTPEIVAVASDVTILTTRYVAPLVVVYENVSDDAAVAVPETPASCHCAITSSSG